MNITNEDLRQIKERIDTERNLYSEAYEARLIAFDFAMSVVESKGANKSFSKGFADCMMDVKKLDVSGDYSEGYKFAEKYSRMIKGSI